MSSSRETPCISTSDMPAGYYNSLMHSDYSLLMQVGTSTSLARLEDNVGGAVMQLVEVLRYKAQGRWFESQWYHTSKGGKCVGLTTLPPSRAGASTSWKPQGLSRSVQGLLYHTMKAYRRSRCTAPLESGEWSASHPAWFTARKGTPFSYTIKSTWWNAN